MKKIIISALVIGILALGTFTVFAQRGPEGGLPEQAAEKARERIKEFSRERNQDSPSQANIDLICMQTAIEKRENAVIASWDALNNSVKTILIARRDSLKVAWAISDFQQRKDAIKNAWEKFRIERKNIAAAFKNAKKAAWNTFKEESRACKATATFDVQGNELNF